MPLLGEAVADCPRCGGSGWLLSEDGRAGSAAACDCRRETLVARLLAAAEIPQRYRHCELASFKIDIQGEGIRDNLLAARRLSERYVETFLGLEGGLRDSGLLFVGPPGSGKTHLAVAILQELIRRYRVQGLFVDFTTLVHQIQSTFDSNVEGTKRELLERVTDAEVLVLDELGAQKPTPWVTDLLYLVINGRYGRRRPTLFTTNYALEEPRARSLDEPDGATSPELLSARIPARILSRLYEMARPVTVESVDFRREFRVFQHDV